MRVTMLGLFALVAAPAAAAAAAAAQGYEQLDVVIIGAGWAGMAAADSLARANISFVVLESTGRTGGRSHALTFGHPSVWTGVVERGSNWVSGVAPPGVTKGGAAGVAKGLEDLPWENPVHTLARQQKLAMVRIPGAADGNMSLYNAVYTSGGDSGGDPGARIRTAANKALDCVNSSWARKVPKTTPLRDGLTKCGWRPHTEEELAVDWAMSGEDANGEPARKESLVSFDPDSSYKWWGPDDMFVVDQHPRGFARMIDGMVRDSVPQGDSRLHFDTEVTKMQYDCHGVKVSTADGRTYSAKEVISTLPLGVLHRTHTKLFDPPLPAAQAELMTPTSGYLMGNLTHVLVQFPTAWWDDEMAKWLSANKGSNRSAAGGPDGAGPNAAGAFSLWHNLNHRSILPGSKTLLTFLGDPQSSVYEGLPNATVQAAVVKRLREQHPHATIPEPTAFFISRHGYDKNTHGAYSISFAGWDDKLHVTLSQPVMDTCGAIRIQLAGEAMCDDLNGYTHGALQSGKEAAARYLHGQGKGPDPSTVGALSLCNK